MEQSEIKLIMVTKETMHEQTVLRNLLKMYCYDWSQYNKLEVNADGDFAFEAHASDYWTKVGYHAFLIAVHERWAGFVLFDTFPGRWEIGCHPKNEASVQFWNNVIQSCATGTIEVRHSCPEYVYHDGTYGDVFSFKA
jgi:predicted acetyltransferase